MGLFDFITGGNDPEKTVAKHRKKLIDPYRQSNERYLAMDELAKISSPSAISALLERFTIRVSGPTVDEEEKTYCYQLLVSLGDIAVAPLSDFIEHKTAVYFPLRALRDIAGDDVAVDTLLKAMEGCDPGYHDGLERLREIVSNLRDFRHERVRASLVEMLASRSDEIRFYALDGLCHYGSDEVAGVFADRLADPNESQRVKGLACELAIEHGFVFKERATDVATGLGEMYRLDSDFKIARKTS